MPIYNKSQMTIFFNSSTWAFICKFSQPPTHGDNDDDDDDTYISSFYASHRFYWVNDLSEDSFYHTADNFELKFKWKAALYLLSKTKKITGDNKLRVIRLFSELHKKPWQAKIQEKSRLCWCLTWHLSSHRW